MEQNENWVLQGYVQKTNITYVSWRYDKVHFLPQEKKPIFPNNVKFIDPQFKSMLIIFHEESLYKLPYNDQISYFLYHYT